MSTSLLFIFFGLILSTLEIPTDLLTHRSILNGLITEFMTSTNQVVLLGFIGLIAFGCWMLLTLIIWFFLRLNHFMAKQAHKGNE